ncbi:MAG: hypothetical protein L3J71_15550 [Victivallaceae bacterium]|nr:hypothetical protein [Victivallaceae bacterium]
MMDADTWILEAGDEIIHLKENQKRKLSDIETFIYLIWILDYAVRNAGAKEALEDFQDFDLSIFSSLCIKFEMPYLPAVLKAGNNDLFCVKYYDVFEQVISKLKEKYKITKG